MTIKELAKSLREHSRVPGTDSYILNLKSPDKEKQMKEVGQKFLMKFTGCVCSCLANLGNLSSISTEPRVALENMREPRTEMVMSIVISLNTEMTDNEKRQKIIDFFAEGLEDILRKALKKPEKSRSNGLQPFSNKFLLITGSEGTGKSLFPKALEKMLKDHYGDRYEYFRLPIADMLRKFGSRTAVAVATILDRARENEKKDVVTLIHLDNLEYLIPQYQRPRETCANLGNSAYPAYYQSQTPPSDAEFNYAIQTLEPVVEVIRQFGKDIGADSHNVIVYGESRAPREFLPEGVARTFRRNFSLDKPTAADVQDILRVQINITKENAQRTGRDPFVEDIESRLQEIAKHALGLNGRLIQQAIQGIAVGKNVEGVNSLITYEDICTKLDNERMTRGLITDGPESRPIGFDLPHRRK